ncbi:MAG: peptidylprolyl isomerase [Bacteroidaceae bacterium]|nr:peptidylprolyl isomerase [Bacteroidaceae bacterium]MBQ5475918.1 peptidylprolyl isomerase [Lachnospiraceae bacterium]
MKKITTMLILLLVICACKAEKKMTPFSTLSDDDTVVLIETSSGEIKVKLYNDTPKHRDNFIKNVKNHMYDGIIFHRVVKNFMIQTGDPSARDVPQGAPAGGGDVSWTVPAEIVYPKYFHKYGALAAARENDDVNPEKESSGCQFYIVTGTKWTEAKLMSKENELNDVRQKEYFNQLVKECQNEVAELRKKKDTAKLLELQDSLERKSEEMLQTNPAMKITPEQIKIYSTIGGMPHLDNNYTVFGEVIEGMDIVEAISNVRTDRRNRPVDDITINKITIIQ